MSDFQQNTTTNRQAVLDYIQSNTSQTLEQVLTQGNSTGDIQILSPDTLSELNVFDGQISLGCNDGINSSSVIETSVSYSLIETKDLITNDYSSLSQTFDETYIDVVFNDGESENRITINQSGIILMGVPSYDDNAAAIAAGLTTGHIFKTTGQGAITTSGVLCIVELE